MERLAAFPEESWQPVVCRICRHPFAIAVEDAEVVPVVLCQTCTLLAEWFGQEEAPPNPAPPEPVKAETPPKRAGKAPRKERQQAQLGSLLERWGDLWHSSEEQE